MLNIQPNSLFKNTSVFGASVPELYHQVLEHVILIQVPGTGNLSMCHPCITTNWCQVCWTHLLSYSTCWATCGACHRSLKVNYKWL